MSTAAFHRTVTDLPWQGVAIRFRLTTRRFFCDNGDCRRIVFTEPLPQVAARYARRTDRLADALRLIGYALSSEAGARLAGELGLAISPYTLPRRLWDAAPAPAQTPRALGVDDWAYRKGYRYGTLLVDLDRRYPGSGLLASVEESGGRIRPPVAAPPGQVPGGCQAYQAADP